MSAALSSDRPPTAAGLTYAVGDVHGRLDLLDRMISHVREDAARTAPGERPVLVILGDVIDRGPQSSGCVDRLVRLGAGDWCELQSIYGNHEHALLTFLDDPSAGSGWLRHGGGQTLSSYGMDPPRFQHSRTAWDDTRQEFAAALPPAHLAFFKGMRLWYESGDYLFVHAGVRPGVPLDEQDSMDLLSIRDEFLKSERACDRVVVHGHTPLNAPRFKRWRISLDTGAFASGLLSGVRLHGSSQELIQVGAG